MIPHYDRKREAYLLYLTVYNSILIDGPVSRTELIQQVKTYSILTSLPLDPMTALEGLIKTGALVTNMEAIALPVNYS